MTSSMIECSSILVYVTSLFLYYDSIVFYYLIIDFSRFMTDNKISLSAKGLNPNAVVYHATQFQAPQQPPQHLQQQPQQQQQQAIHSAGSAIHSAGSTESFSSQLLCLHPTEYSPLLNNTMQHQHHEIQQQPQNSQSLYYPSNTTGPTQQTFSYNAKYINNVDIINNNYLIHQNHHQQQQQQHHQNHIINNNHIHNHVHHQNDVQKPSSRITIGDILQTKDVNNNTVINNNQQRQKHKNPYKGIDDPYDPYNKKNKKITDFAIEQIPREDMIKKIPFLKQLNAETQAKIALEEQQALEEKRRLLAQSANDSEMKEDQSLVSILTQSFCFVSH